MAMASSVIGPSSALSPCSPQQIRGLYFFSSRRASLKARSRRPISIALRATASDGAQLKQSIEEEQHQAQEEVLWQRMQALGDSMDLPDNYFIQLPKDLRTDLKDAAFALASGPVQRECGELAGGKLLQLSQAWEKGDTQAATIAAEELQYVIPDELSLRAAVGRRLIGAGRLFSSTGSYGKGELQKISKALMGAGEALRVNEAVGPNEEPPEMATRMYKFGDLQVELTAQKCFIGCVVALGFGALSWGLTASLQNIPESASQYANENATLLATSLRGALLFLGYGCTVLSAFALVGLLGLGFQLSTKQNTGN